MWTYTKITVNMNGTFIAVVVLLFDFTKPVVKNKFKIVANKANAIQSFR